MNLVPVVADRNTRNVAVLLVVDSTIVLNAALIGKPNIAVVDSQSEYGTCVYVFRQELTP